VISDIKKRGAHRGIIEGMLSFAFRFNKPVIIESIICRSNHQGGLDIIDLEIHNQCLLRRWGFNLLNTNGEWQQWIQILTENCSVFCENRNGEIQNFEIFGEKSKKARGKMMNFGENGSQNIKYCVLQKS
jgi:hypothetical protein